MIMPLVVAMVILMWLPAQNVRADSRIEVWTLIQKDDMAAVGARLAASELGEQRNAFGAFVTADPVVDAFSRRMLEANPDDSKVMTARGWALLKQGFAMRGTCYGRAVYPEASRRMRDLHEEAMILARGALAADPTLIPASDLFIELSKTLGLGNQVPDEFARVMAQQANRQSLILAAAALAPAWGGSVDFGLQACDDWAARIPDPEGYTPELCKIDVIYSVGYPADLRDSVAAFLLQDDTPFLDGARLREASSGALPDEVSLAIFKRAAGRGDLTFHEFRRWDSLEGHEDPFTPGPRAARAPCPTRLQGCTATPISIRATA